MVFLALPLAGVGHVVCGTPALPHPQLNTFSLDNYSEFDIYDYDYALLTTVIVDLEAHGAVITLITNWR